MGCNSSIQVGLENINKKPILVCVLGLINSGKTSIIEYLAGEYVFFFFFNIRMLMILLFIQMVSFCEIYQSIMFSSDS